jgi:uncharacterized protein (TIGR02466 family)
LLSAENREDRGAKSVLADIARNGQVEILFPTPLFWHVLRGCEDLNAELADIILEREASQSSALKSNIGGWQSEPDFFKWNSDAVRMLDLLIRGGLDTATSRVISAPAFGVEFDLYGWAAVNRRSHYNTAHLHPMATWSGVYYIDPGDEPPELSGASLEFVHPIPASAMTFFPGHLGSARLVRPVASMLLIFPSYVLHSVRLYQGDRPRICVPFNAHSRS